MQSGGPGTEAAVKAPRRKKRRGPSECSRCGYSLRGLPTGVCPECGFENPESILEPRDARLDRVFRVLNGVYVVCLVAAVVLIGWLIWRAWEGRLRYSTLRWAGVVLIVPLAAYRVWQTGREQWVEDVSPPRAVYGVLGALATIAAELAVVWLLM